MENPGKRKLLSTSLAILLATVSLSTMSGENKETGYNQPSDLTQQPKSEDPSSAKMNSRYSDEKMKNAWLEGKLEMALLLNRHLNNFTIDHTVIAGKAVLEGTVESDVDRELAKQVALSIDGIESVDNRLEVNPEKYKAGKKEKPVDRSFSQKIDDMTTTAAIKTKILANGSTHGLAINVDTVNKEVLLQGDVSTAEEKELAEKIAENTEGVYKVDNRIQVKP